MNQPPKLRGRAGAVFEQYFTGRADNLHADDRETAEDFWNLLGTLEPPAEALRVPAAGRRWWMAAAVAVLVCIPLAAVLSQWNGWPSQSDVYRTARAETSSLKLTDGSSIRLGAQSAVDVRFDGKERRVRLLSGEAIFNVAKDKRHPFIVETPGGEFRALGTAFMVRMTRKETRLFVIEGVVKVEPDDAPGAAPISRIAKAGEGVALGVTSSGQSSRIEQVTVGNVEPAEVALATGWTRGMLYFRGEPLAEVVEVVNRYARQPVEDLDPALADMPVYAAMRIGDTAAVRAIIDDPDAAR